MKSFRRSAAVSLLALSAGIAASVSGNLQAINLDNAAPGIGAYISSVFWPLALFAVIEIFLHTPWVRSWRDHLTQLVAVGLVGFVALWVSYWHLEDVLAAYGYDAVASHLGPLAVDGMMALATLSLNRVGQARRAPVVQDTPAPIVVQVDSGEDTIDLTQATDKAMEQAGHELAQEAEHYLSRLSRELDSTTTPAVPVVTAELPQRRPAPRAKAPEPELTEVLTAWDAAGRPMRPGEVDRLLAAYYGVSERTIRRRREALGLI